MGRQSDSQELITKIKILEGRENRCECQQRESSIFLKMAQVTGKGLWAADLKGDIIYVNQNICRLLGVSDPDFFIGKCVYQYYSPLSRELLMREILPVVMKTGHWGGEMTILSFYGVTIHTYEDYFLISDDEGSPLYLCTLVNDISQHKSIENPFLRNEEKYRIITEQTGLMLCDCDLLSGYVLWSGAVEAITGYTADEFRHFDLQGWKDRFHPDDALKIKDRFLQALENGGKYREEFRFRRKDGGYVDIEENSVFLQNIDGTSIKMLGVMKDITEKKRFANALSEANERLEWEVERRTENLASTNKNLIAEIERRRQTESALRESEAQYRAVVEGQTELIGRFLPDYRIIFVNEALCRYFSIPRVDLIGKSFFPMLHPDDRPRVQTFYESLTPEQPFGMNEHRVVLATGEIRWQQWTAKAIYEESKLIEFQSVGRDVTDRVNAEEALRESEERYRIVTKHSADGVVVTRKGQLMYVNDAFAYMCGYDDPKMLIEQSVAEYIDPSYRSRFIAFMNSVEVGGNKESLFQAVILRPDGKKIWGEGLHTLIKWDGNFAVLATVRDITKAKQREMESQRETTALRRQNSQLASTIKDRYRFGDIIGKSAAMQEVYEQILSAGASSASVVLYGESGTGKELVAKAIHELSDFSEGPFVPVNCGAIPEHLMESEFFGHVRGAFTGATSDKKGFFDFANQGTLFLDEVGNIRVGTQVKMLRAIEGGGHTPLGSNQVKKSNFRIVAATNKPLIEIVKEGLMREDFFFRIHVIPIYLPPLRERKEDIPLLIDHFMRSFSRGHAPRVLSGKIHDAFVEYSWPGNVRELQNVLQRYLTIGRLEFASGWSAKTIEPSKEDVFDEIVGDDLRVKVENYERQIIIKSMEKVRWNRTRLCELLKIPRRTLTYKLNKYGIK